MEELVKALRGVLEDRYGRVLVEKTPEYSALYVPSRRLLVCVYIGVYSFYAKIVSLDHASDCGAAALVPQGLYVFADTPSRLAEKIINKIEMIR